LKNEIEFHSKHIVTSLSRIGAAIAVFSVAILLNGCTGGSTAFSDALGAADGGTGSASIAITSYSPPSANLVVKAEASQQFLVSAVGKGNLVYNWTLDGVSVGGQTSSFTLNSGLPVGQKVLKLTIADEVGTVSQEWNVKVNGTPVVDASSPAALTVASRRLSQQNYSVTVSDPNSDTLTYVWKLDGQEGVLNSTTASQSWAPSLSDVGQHTVSVDIYDGPASDLGTYKVTRSWSTAVNHFADACNKMENEAQTNKTCVLTGVAGIGDGIDPETASSSILLRPSALATTSEGNLFIGDDENHVVWFWNKYSSPSIEVLGVTVPQNTIKVVVGAGYPNNGNSASLFAARIFLNSPHGLVWDAGDLYVSDASNNRVIKVDSTGAYTTVNSAGCNSPRGLAKVGNQLFIACYSSHVIRVVDTDTLVGATFAGTGAAGDPTSTAESTFTDATQGRLRGPYGLAADSAGDLYLSEYDGCRVRVYNRASAGSKQIFGASWTVSLNRQRLILGAAGAANCGTYTAGEAVNLSGATDARVRQLRLLSFDSAGHLLISGENMYRVSALNFNAGADLILGTSVPGYSIAPIIGTGTAGYLGEGLVSSASRIHNTYQTVQNPVSTDFIVGDRDNRRLRKANTTDFKTSLLAGNGSYRNVTNTGQSTVEAGQEKMNQPRGIVQDPVTGQIFVADSGNHRIRAISKYGEVSQAVGTGTAGSGGEEDELPTNSTMNQPRGLVLTNATTTPAFGGNLVWADSQNHRVRIWNRSSVQATLFGVTVGAGHVATIGGTGTAGTVQSGSALQDAFNQPSGVASDGTNLYVSDRNNSCIKKIDPAGDLTVVAGTCGATGNQNGAVGVGRMTNPEGLAYYSSGGHTGLLIAAQGNTRVKFLRFAGPSTLLFGTTITVGDTNSVACGTAAAAGSFNTEGVGASLAVCSGVYDVAAFEGKFCFTNNGFHNVRCVEPNGAISTVMGAVQGIDDTVNMYFPGVPFSDVTYNPASPNYMTQNGVTAFFLPSPLLSATDAPPLKSAFGQLMFPRTVYMVDAKTLLVSDFIGLVRKVKVP
jgi:hypothetical protein